MVYDFISSSRHLVGLVTKCLPVEFKGVWNIGRRLSRLVLIWLTSAWRSFKNATELSPFHSMTAVATLHTEVITPSITIRTIIKTETIQAFIQKQSKVRLHFGHWSTHALIFLYLDRIHWILQIRKGNLTSLTKELTFFLHAERMFVFAWLPYSFIQQHGNITL